MSTSHSQTDSEICIEQTNQHCSERVWAAAYVLYNYLISNRSADDASQANISLQDRPIYLYTEAAVNVLELGAGTGWLALQIHEACPTVNWCATESPHFGAMERLEQNINERTIKGDPVIKKRDCDGIDDLPTLHQNVDTNKRRKTNLTHPKECDKHGSPEVKPGIVLKRDTESGTLRAESLDWIAAKESPLVTENWDLIVGSDLIYSSEGARLLVECLHVLLSAQDTNCLYAHTCGRWNGHGFDQLLHSELLRVGLDAIAVGGDTLNGSSESKQHVVVFEIRLRTSQNCSTAESIEGSIEDGAHHVLLRAARLEKEEAERLEATMTNDEVMEMQGLQQLFGGLT
ncbi:hypothetical protein SARC_02048 [Sphaeroforma arctica JP610]|uniref:Methyltransferase domain-containing protein n=1 Tax=Sphaeroforma arctica JP610 TaxID=667725 RepID=A0A0L0G9V8_9EUKA|nr:hypothetical protein SARC_02048 [Sphaeroforma arctica JP610]KNC85785.1 hypothetical protein SARC_02048 [Sphaeroforma arctica JP610]|eukprot:XP_014159687.1 hypothetical protein SARC_02048 [Sphaeroforma arctica JP610]